MLGSGVGFGSGLGVGCSGVGSGVGAGFSGSGVTGGVDGSGVGVGAGGVDGSGVGSGVGAGLGSSGVTGGSDGLGSGVGVGSGVGAGVGVTGFASSPVSAPDEPLARQVTVVLTSLLLTVAVFVISFSEVTTSTRMRAMWSPDSSLGSVKVADLPSALFVTLGLVTPMLFQSMGLAQSP